MKTDRKAQSINGISLAIVGLIMTGLIVSVVVAYNMQIIGNIREGFNDSSVAGSNATQAIDQGIEDMTAAQDVWSDLIPILGGLLVLGVVFLIARLARSSM